MNAATLHQTLSQLGKGMATVAGVIASELYSCPTRDWLQNDFGPALKRDLDRLGVAKYVPVRNDCTDFSLYSMALARLSHNLSTTAQSALAFGTVDYMHEVDGALPEGHRTNLAVVFENGVYVPVFFEPQLQQIITLTEEELSSIRAYYI